jgi:hypothetical protein
VGGRGGTNTMRKIIMERVSIQMVCWLVIGLSIMTNACSQESTDLGYNSIARRVYVSFVGTPCQMAADAVWSKDTLRLKELIKTDPVLVKRVCGEHDKTLLHLAAVCRDARSAEILIRGGASISSPDAGMKSPLYNAVFVDSNCEVIELLCRYGADPNRIEYELAVYPTSFMFACSITPSNIECLLNNGAKIQVESQPRLNALSKVIQLRLFGTALKLLAHSSCDVAAMGYSIGEDRPMSIDSIVVRTRESILRRSDSRSTDVSMAQKRGLDSLMMIEQMIRSKNEEK